jgi:hypothetical protein
MQVDCEFCADGAPAKVVASTPNHVYVMCNCHREAYVDGQAAPFREITAIQYPAMDCCGAPAVAVGLDLWGRPLGPYLCETCCAAYQAGQAASSYRWTLWWIDDVRLAPREGGGYSLTGIRAEGDRFVDVDDGRAGHTKKNIEERLRLTLLHRPYLRRWYAQNEPAFC